MINGREKRITAKPSRKALLSVIGELQEMAGRARAIYLDDVSINRAEKLLPLLEKMSRLCIDARSFDPPD